ncbi:MAG: hypothetical protein AAF483_13775 [Planctomycetota bacterium]
MKMQKPFTICLAILTITLGAGKASAQLQQGNDQGEPQTAPESVTGGLDSFRRELGSLSVDGLSTGGANNGGGLGTGGLGTGGFGTGGFGGGLGGGLGGFGGGLGGFGGGFGGFGGGFNNQFNQNNQNQNSIRATVKLGFTMPMPAPEVRAREIASLFTRLPIPAQIRGVNLQLDGKTAIVTGTLKDKDQARILKGLLMLEPGIYKVDDKKLTFSNAEDESSASDQLEMIEPIPADPSPANSQPVVPLPPAPSKSR